MPIHDHTKIIEDADYALEILKDGNRRYLKGRINFKGAKEYSEIRSDLTDSQHPFSVILTCSDSRVAPEIFFDQKLGDIFVIRNAGNICDNTVLGSIEYTIEYLKSPLVVVVGHTSCGAVTAAINDSHGHPANVQHLIDLINSSHDLEDSLDIAIIKNVEAAVKTIKNNEVIIKNATRVIGAVYDIKTGQVRWI